MKTIRARGRDPRGSGHADGYHAILSDIVRLLDEGRRTTARAVNRVMTATYWAVGRRIVEHEQGGLARADYGDTVLERLAVDLTARLGRGFSRQNLQRFRQFYLTFPLRQIRSTVSSKFIGPAALPELARAFPLPWSHTAKGEALVRYATDNLPTKLLVRNYLTVLPDEEVIAAEIARTRRRIEGRSKASLLESGAVKR